MLQENRAQGSSEKSTEVEQSKGGIFDDQGCVHEGKSVFEVLLQRNPGAAEEILNAGIGTNFQVSLLIIGYVGSGVA